MRIVPPVNDEGWVRYEDVSPSEDDFLRFLVQGFRGGGNQQAAHEFINQLEQTFLQERQVSVSSNAQTLGEIERLSKYCATAGPWINFIGPARELVAFLLHAFPLVRLVDQNNHALDIRPTVLQQLREWLTIDLPIDDEDPNDGQHEGTVQYRLHKLRERSRLIRQQRIQQANDDLRCEVCGFEFAARYGEIGNQFIEVHHINPIGLADPGGVGTRVEDLALVCSNCHRMLHRRDPQLGRWLTMDELRNRMVR
jgi:hypothetical protein